MSPAIAITTRPIRRVLTISRSADSSLVHGSQLLPTSATIAAKYGVPVAKSVGCGHVCRVYGRSARLLVAEPVEKAGASVRPRGRGRNSLFPRGAIEP